MTADRPEDITPGATAGLTVLRIATVMAYAGIIASSLGPRDLRPSTGFLPGFIEHATAYFVLGVISSLLAARSRRIRPTAAANVALAGVLETLQLVVPGRVASPLDFLGSSSGALLGALAVALLQHRR